MPPKTLIIYASETILSIEIGAVRHAHHVVTLSGKVASQDLVATTRPHRILLLYRSGEEGTRIFCCDCYFFVYKTGDLAPQWEKSSVADRSVVDRPMVDLA